MKKVKLGEVLDVKRGMSAAGEFYSTEGKLVRLTLGNFNYPNGGFKENTSKDNIFYIGDVKPEFILHEGDIITPLTEQVAGLLGETARIPVDGKYIQTGDIGLIIPNEKLVDKSFVYYLVSSKTVKEQLGAAAQQTKIRHTSPDKIKDCTVWLPEKQQQEKIGDLLDAINKKIANNNAINDNLQQTINTIYEYWFYQFNFPNAQAQPYKLANGGMSWNESIKRYIPASWKVQNFYDNSLYTVISSGIKPFTQKIYLATADVNGCNISEGSSIDYETRESRANMQPRTNSVWFAKMKNSIKHLFFNREMDYFIQNAILSTGFYGLQCSESSFEYIAATINTPHFESLKDKLSHGATQQGIGDDDLRNMALIVPDDATILKFHNATNGLFAQFSQNIIETKRLQTLRDFLLPLLMNGQAIIAD